MCKANVFFSYHYAFDAERAAVVRGLNLVHANTPEPLDRWSDISSDIGRTREWIAESLARHDVLVVLVGERTSNRPLVHLEIEQAAALEMPIVGVRIHRLAPSSTRGHGRGLNPFDRLKLHDRAGQVFRPRLVETSTVDPVGDLRANLGRWVQRAWRNEFTRERRAEEFIASLRDEAVGG
ncbi:hypothetical protein FIV34_11680 [Luteibacter pinisoli]|uniref:Thoeris protein ThsB TIR-like domain-containing protein n=1 Tax=Luteibacter pinisoli TaxID=2589080 RepID=A0A4Y5Z3G3_9GAMM|nr:TIR domain-containing protein [Luteibacter pinisoli]QDE39821.1 hypothetical protein FIV34_11680 [Luteibacter pinisoli]